MSKFWQDLKSKAWSLFDEHNLLDKYVTVKARPLSTNEAIGEPEKKDFPLQKGKEKLMQAEFEGFAGQAYTDQFGDYEGSIGDIIAMELNDNFQRAVFVSTLNAVLKYLGKIEGTLHCRDTEPAKCAYDLRDFIKQHFSEPKITIIGLQPRFVEVLSDSFSTRAVDMDPKNIGANMFNVRIEGPETTKDAVDWADLLVVTGTTLVNDTIGQFLDNHKPKLFFGTTIAGAAWLIGWSRFCSMSS